MRWLPRPRSLATPARRRARGWGGRQRSSVTKKAVQRKAVRGVVAEIELPEGATLATGKPREGLGQLEGSAYQSAAPLGWTANATDDRLKVEWVVLAPAGGAVKLLAQHPRAGVVRATVSL